MGNKIDREDREIPTHVGEDFAVRHNMYFLETSAKEADNVEKLFMQIAEDLMKVGGVICVCFFLNLKMFKFNFGCSKLEAGIFQGMKIPRPILMDEVR